MRAVRQPSPPSVCSPVHEPSRRSSLPSFARQLDLPQVAAAADATGQKMLSVAAKRAKARGKAKSSKVSKRLQEKGQPQSSLCPKSPKMGVRHCVMRCTACFAWTCPLPSYWHDVNSQCFLF